MDGDLVLLFVPYLPESEKPPARVRSLSIRYLLPFKLQVVAHMKRNLIYRRTDFPTIKKLYEKKMHKSSDRLLLTQPIKKNKIKASTFIV